MSLAPITTHASLQAVALAHSASVGTKCCASSSRDYSNLSEVRNCVKCAELEMQLQQVRDELSSVQLITQTLNKEHVQEDTVATSTQQMEAELEVDDSWKR